MIVKKRDNIVSRKTRINVEAYSMIIPSYAIYLIFVLFPMILTIYYSFTNYDLYKTMDFIGLANYKFLLKDQFFLKSVKNTIIYSIFTVLPPMVIGLLLAVVLNGDMFGKNICRASIYLPYVISMVSISMVWLWIYDPSYGILNTLMKALKLPQQSWLFNVRLALGSLIVMAVWRLLGYTMIIYLAGLQNIPRQLYEAARIDGASKLRQLFFITIPMLRPTTFFLFVVSIINSFNVFDQIKVMTDGHPMNATTTVVHQIYQRAFMNFKMGYASSMTVFLVIVTLALTLISFRYGRQGTDIEL